MPQCAMVIVLTICLGATSAFAQSGRLLETRGTSARGTRSRTSEPLDTSMVPAFGLRAPVQTVESLSLIHITIPEPPEIQLHDIVTVIVDEKSQVKVTSRFNRQRNGTLKAELKEFIRLGKDGNLTNAASNAPTIDGSVQNRLQANGEITDGEGVQYRIAAVVTEKYPNGTLYIEARKSIRSNRDVWTYTLSGTVRAEDIDKSNTIKSEDIAHLDIAKDQRGKVYDSTKAAWGTRILDVIFPF